MAPARLALVLHAHQPVGALEETFADSTRSSWAPLIELLGKTPSARVALHLSGPVLEWLEPRRSDLLAIVRLLATRGQIEVVGGALYEPVVAVLPDADAVGQIRRMTAECERLFGKRPVGMWLAQGAWEPDLARVLAIAGMQYTLVDQAAFRLAGLVGELSGYWVTEKAGAPVALFPADTALAAAMRQRDPREVAAEIAQRADGAVTVAIDADHEDVAPVHEWLGPLLRALEAQGGVELGLPAEVIARSPARGRTYLPACAGPAWQDVLVRRDEANRLHKKMLRVSRQIAARTPPEPRAVTALYRGQCGDAMSDGRAARGGLHAPHLRHAAYFGLLDAEVLAEPAPRPRAEVNDHDGDFWPELLLETAALDVYVKPDAGGAVFEIDDRVRRKCLTDVLSEDGRRVRRAFVDRLLPIHAKGPDAIEAGAGDVPIADLAAAEYDVVEASEDETAAWALLRVETAGLRLRKALRLAGDAARLEVAYDLRRVEGASGPCTFVVESAFALPAAPGPQRYWELPQEEVRPLEARGTCADVGEIHAIDKRAGIRLVIEASPAAEVWRAPIEAGGHEQGTMIAFAWRTELAKEGPPLRATLVLRIDLL